MILKRTFSFDAAHMLPGYNGKCRNLHGHTYRLGVKISGATTNASGMVMDFAELKGTVTEQVLSKLDHAYINDIIPLPTAENMAVWIWDKLSPVLKRPNCRLYEIELWETPDSCVIYTGD